MEYIDERGFYLYPDGMGHGIGEELHMRPFISLTDYTDFNYLFKPGDIFTLEPIVFLYKDSVSENILGEGLIESGNCSSQFEITIYIDLLGDVVVLNRALIN